MKPIDPHFDNPLKGKSVKAGKARRPAPLEMESLENRILLSGIGNGLK